MQGMTNRVRAELVKCETWYAKAGENIRLLTERTEEIWFQMDGIVCDLQEAEARDDTPEVNGCLQSLIHYSQALQTEVLETRRKRMQ